MRHLRILKQDVWYEIHTVVNNREPLFRIRQALALFRRVLDDTRKRFVFEMTGLRLVGDRLTFYIKPANGLGLPDILKWMKQTFAVRYNHLTGRIGHIWGDRYWSVILEGEPPEDAEWEEEEEAQPKARGRGGAKEGARKDRVRRGGVRPQKGKKANSIKFFYSPLHFGPSPPP